MEWTYEGPTTDGWYLCRQPANAPPKLVFVTITDDGMVYHDPSSPIGPYRAEASDEALWFGPIPDPE